MRTRIHGLVISAAATILAGFPSPAVSQGPRGISSVNIGGDNVRVTAGRAIPHAGLHNWESGLQLGVAWESWSGGGSDGLPRVGAGLSLTYSSLPFARETFVTDFQTSTGKTVTEASASNASLADLMLTLRLRGPTFLVMPSLLIGVGYYDFRPSTISFRATDSTGTARTRGKNGPSASIGVGLDGPVIGRTALFAEAVWAYGWSSDNYLSQSAGSRCTGNVCDTFKSTQAAMLRGGVRVRLGR